MISDTFWITTPEAILSPAGGESWGAGSNQILQWEIESHSNVAISYSTDNGETWKTIIDSTENTGSYPWTVPDDVSMDCKIKIEEVAG